jgi:hypothetical protein
MVKIGSAFFPNGNLSIQLEKWLKCDRQFFSKRQSIYLAKIWPFGDPQNQPF